jgi:glycosyltransferase involved in cell wall biosynthesis
MPTTSRGTRPALRGADRVVAVGADLARAVARAGVPRARLSVIAPGCDGVPRVARRVRGVRDGRLHVLAVANWSPAKGIATLVAAATRVPEVHLDLVGDAGSGAYRDAVLTRIRSNVRGNAVVLHGVLDGRRLAQRYADADVFVLPTEREGYGTVFAEALTCGLPVIAADIAPVREIVGDAGLFVPPRRVRPLVSALRLMTDPWLRRRLARAARARGRVLPTWAVSEAAFVDLLGREMRTAVAGS